MLLHANSTQTYKEVAELYRSNAKGVPVVKKEPVTASVIAAPVSTPAPALLSAPPSNDAYIRGPQDKRATRGPLLAKPMHRQSAPIRHQAGGYGGEQSIRAAPYARGNSNVAPWNGYQQHQQYSDTAWGRDNNGPPQQHGGAPFAPGRARIVEYAPPPAGGAFAAPPQHYPVDNWGYNRSSMPPPSAYSNAAIYGAGAAPFGRPSAQDLVYDYRGATNSANLERVKVRTELIGCGDVCHSTDWTDLRDARTRCGSVCPRRIRTAEAVETRRAIYSRGIYDANLTKRGGPISRAPCGDWLLAETIRLREGRA